MADKESVKAIQNIYGPVTGLAGNVEGDMNIYALEQSQTLAEAATEIQALLAQLQSKGVSPEVAQQKAAGDLAVQAQTNPTVRAKLMKWGQSLGETASKTTVTEAVKVVIQLAMSLAGIA